MSARKHTVRQRSGLDVVYDGQCRLCRRSLDALQRLARRNVFRLHDANDREMIRSRFPKLADADTDRAMFVVTPRGEVFRGFFAYRRMMWESPWLYPLLALFYAPGAALVGPWIFFRGDAVRGHGEFGFGLQSRGFSFGVAVGFLTSSNAMVGARLGWRL